MSLINKVQVVKSSFDSIRSYWTKPQKHNPTLAFALYCEQHPWAVECKTYEI